MTGMKESRWLSCRDPRMMLTFIHGKATDRRIRLFACACCRQVLWEDERNRTAVAFAEKFADGLITKQEWRPMRNVVRNAARKRNLAIVMRTTVSDARTYAAHVVNWAAKDAYVPFADSPIDRQRQCKLLRDIFGNPFRPVSIDTAWLTWNNATVPSIAQAIYDERELPSGHFDNGQFGILADALTDAGCDNADVLSHCRSDGPHVRGCWVVDLLLQKG